MKNVLTKKKIKNPSKTSNIFILIILVSNDEFYCVVFWRLKIDPIEFNILSIENYLILHLCVSKLRIIKRINLKTSNKKTKASLRTNFTQQTECISCINM